MERTLPGPLTDLLEYLDGIGYRDLYLRPPSEDAKPGAVGAPAGRPASTAMSKAAGPSEIAGSPQIAGTSKIAGSSKTEVSHRPPDRQPTDRRATSPPPAKSVAASFVEVPALLPPEGVPDEIGGRVQILATVARQASTCQACGLCRGRQTVVFGSGHPNADLMLIGEGPGGEEDRRGLPFVGPAGELLNKIIGAIDQSREGVYIANVVKCRPPNNRDPLPDEVAACRAYLEAQIDLVQPKVLVALGRVAAQALLQSTQPLRQLRGAWHEVRGIPTRATYHPAALLRNASWKRPTWEDMKVVRDRLRDLQTP